MSKGGRFERKKKPLNKKKLAWSLTGTVVAVALAAVVLVLSSYMGKIKKVDVEKIEYTKATTEAVATTDATTEVVETTQPHVASSADYINFLVVGQAARAGETERFADTMILCTLNTHTKTLTMTSLLRDSFIKMPDYKGHYGGRIKLTTIYHLGPSMAMVQLALWN